MARILRLASHDHKKLFVVKQLGVIGDQKWLTNDKVPEERRSAG